MTQLFLNKFLQQYICLNNWSFLISANVGAWSIPFFSVPEILNGLTYNATVVGLNPWVEYEFRVVAGNSIGIGEPSKPSELLRTKASGKKSYLLKTQKIFYGIVLKENKWEFLYVQSKIRGSKPVALTFSFLCAQSKVYFLPKSEFKKKWP